MEIRLIDFQTFNRSDPLIDEVDSDTFIIQMFGINESGETFSIEIPNFKPYFYCKVPDSFTVLDKNKFLAHIKSRITLKFADSILECVLINRKKLDGFDGQKDHKFICFKFRGMPCFNKVKNLWYQENKTSIVSRFNRKPGITWGLKPGGYHYCGNFIKLYESNIPPLLRYFHIREISPTGWVKIQNASQVKTKTTTCMHEFIISAKDVIPIQKETIVPYKICSFDIEANSSHGDFPLPIKDYKKLAQNIIDEVDHYTGSDYVAFLNRCILSAFSYDKMDYIEIVYPKHAITQEKLKQDCAIWLSQTLQNYEPIEPVMEETSDSEEEGSLHEYDQSRTVVELIQDKLFDKESKLNELRKSLNHVFPPLEGDKVTFIGSTFVHYGTPKPYLNHCIVLGGCSAVDNAIIESYDTETKVLLAWKDLIQKENPDIMIGYNIFGFDEEFLFRRATELDCADEFLNLTRNKNILSGKFVDGSWQIEETSVFLASGEYNLKYFKMDGRLQLDLYTLFRRDYNFDSYKLDAVSAALIGDKVSKIEYDDNTTLIYSKNLQGLEKTNYVVFEVISHSSDYYHNGQKFKVVDVCKGYFIIKSIVRPDMKKQVKWCLAKDDVDHHDIFRLSKGSDDDRAIIATYCIQDCNLVHHLLQKTDMITGFIEMGTICSVPFDMLVMRGQGIKLTSFISKKCRERNMLMPVIEKSEYDDGYEGAIVLDPKCNIYSDDPIPCNDFGSLYPCCMISKGLSSEAKVWVKQFNLEGELKHEWGEKRKGEFIYDNLPEYTYIDIQYDTFDYVRKTPKAKAVKVKSGYKVCRWARFPDKRPLMASVLEELLVARKETRKLIPLQKDDFMKNILDKRQLAIKVTANSLYGQCGARTSQFYDMDVAACCTATGREYLIYSKTIIEEVFQERICETSKGTVTATAEYVYGDTDSVFFKFKIIKDGIWLRGKDALELSIELAKEAGRITTMWLEPPHDLEYEKTFLPFVLLSKKRYVGMMYEEDITKCVRKSMGIVLKRRDNAPIVKDVYGGLIDILMKEYDISKALEFVRNCLKKLVEGTVPIEKLIVTKSLRSGYKNPLQIAHKVLAERIGKRGENKPRPGDRIKFAYIQIQNKKALQGEKIETPEFIQENKLALNYTHYISNQLMKPIQQVFALVLEDIPEFQERKLEFLNDLNVWRKKLNDEKYEAKEMQLRNKEIKRILFDKYLK